MTRLTNTTSSVFFAKFLFALFMVASLAFVKANAASIEFSDQDAVQIETKPVTQSDLDSLAEFITTKFKHLSTLDKESKIYTALHTELFGQEGLVEDYMEMTDYDFNQINRLYASGGGLTKFN